VAVTTFEPKTEPRVYAQEPVAVPPPAPAQQAQTYMQAVQAAAKQAGPIGQKLLAPVSSNTGPGAALAPLGSSQFVRVAAALMPKPPATGDAVRLALVQEQAAKAALELVAPGAEKANLANETTFKVAAGFI
jgi:hypothetical protein